ncbi:MAG: DUF3185 family protein [Desulfuromonadaceae bacterium]|nr:DUF3185 family protein [Desulfuromonadaceae bacterium]
MAVKSGNNKLIGIVLLVIGVGIAFWGYQLAGSLSGQLSKTLTGSPTDKVMMMYIGAASCVVAGLFMTIKR